MVPEIGQRYGPYEILGRIGGGGMGHVFRAWDARLHREVAIKLLHDEYAMPGMRERFLREARAASALSHPNICTIFDIGEQRGDPYLVMEMLEGVTLKDRIRSQTIQVDEMMCIAREIAKALEAAHAKGVVHRDIKPANIFLVEKPNKGFQAKVLDFGLAKFEGGTLGGRGSRALDLTAAGATVGTLAYMSPEQARGESLDSRSDLFSLGVLMYEMATRRIPFTGATSALVFVQLLNHAPEPVRDWNDSIPRDLEKIILKLMAKEKTGRFQTAQELDEALARITDKGTPGWLRKVAVPLVRAPEPIARERRSSRRRVADSRADVDNGGAGALPLDLPVGSPANRSEAQLLRPVARVPNSAMSQTAQREGHTGAGTASTPVSATQFSGHLATALAEMPSTPLSGGGLQLSASAEETSRELARAGSAASVPSFGEELHEPNPSAADQLHERLRAAQNGRGIIFGKRIVITVAALALCLIVAITYAVQHGRGGALLSGSDGVVLTQIENRTGDPTLDGVVTTGLQIVLSEASALRLRSGEAYRLARRQIAPKDGASTPVLSRKIAERLGAKAYFTGALSGTRPYVLHVDLVNSSTNDVMTSADEHAATLQDLPAAIDRISETLRARLGEDKDEIRRNSVPLSHEGSDNPAALRSLSLGEDALAIGNLEQALQSFQQAASLDPQFIQAQLRLAVCYRRQRAEIAAAEAATAASAIAAAASTRTRTLAEYEYKMSVTGDYVTAVSIIRKLTAANPHDAEALDDLARTLRLEGRFTEALQNAQQSYTEDPYNLDAYTQAQNALIGLDRFEAASNLGAQVEAMDIGVLGGGFVSAYLEGQQDLLEGSVAAIRSRGTGFQPDWSLGLYYDNVGRLSAGTTLWKSQGETIQHFPRLDSTAGFLLAQGAIDRALLGECASALAMAHDADAHQQGMTALFNTGMSYALCGEVPRARHAADLLLHTYPQSFAVKGFYVPDIQAAIALASGDPAAALEILKPARQFDLISITPVLRGRANVALRQYQVGIVDFQTVLAHRGAPFIVGNVAYPVAQIGVARAFAATGDLANSATAYRRFLQLWKDADPHQPMVAEALTHSR